MHSGRPLAFDAQSTHQLPPIDSCSSRVRTESRNGMCAAPPFRLVRAAMTLPRARSDVLIFCASERERPCHMRDHRECKRGCKRGCNREGKRALNHPIGGQAGGG